MIDQYPPANGVLTSLIWRKTMSGGETSLSGYDNASQALSYTPGQEQVYLNGILLVRGDDYTATNGISITGLAALSANDFVQVNCYNNFSVASLPSTSITGEITNSQITSLATSKLTGTIANNQLANSSITINGSAVSLGGSTTIAGGSAQDDAPTSPTEGQLWLDTNGTLATTAFVEKTDIGAKGDLFVGSANDTVSILNVGESGSTIIADSSATTGLRWSTVPSSSNPIINSAFDIWQRGTSIGSTAATTVYTADRWAVYTAGTGSQLTITRQATGDTTNLPNIQYCARVTRNNGSTYTNAYYMWQGLETVNSIPFAGKTVTVSFYARKGSGFNDVTIPFRIDLRSGTGTDQNWINGFTGEATVCNVTPSLTTTWQRFTATGTVAATATQLAIVTDTRANATAGANDYFEITGVQLDIGSVALPFRRSANTIAGELAACQRYYWRRSATGKSTLGVGVSESTSTAWITFGFPTEMRIVPTTVEWSGLTVSDGVSYTLAVTSINAATLSANTSSGRISFATAANQIQNRVAVGETASGGGYFALGAEL